MKTIKTANYEETQSTIYFDKNNNPIPHKVNEYAMMIFNSMRKEKISKHEAFNKIMTAETDDEFVNLINTRLEEILTYY